MYQLYLYNAQGKEMFKEKYYNSLRYINETEINRHLSNINNNGATINFRELVSLEFNELLNWRTVINNYAIQFDIEVNNAVTNEFTDLFDYGKNQSSIADFFMRQEIINLNSCPYCGLEYINAFKDIGDYKDEIDFVNRANGNELEKINYIGPITARKIVSARLNGLITNLDDIGLNRRQKENIINFNIGFTHNHFTLDHVLPQNDNKFYSLCLYNLVPCCYSCNSKFKKKLNFDGYNSLERVIPTSENYSLNRDLDFVLYYSGSLENIKTKSDFIIDTKELNNNPHVAKYLEIFKVKGRYTYHKNKALRLIENKNNYPDSMIKEISLTTGLSLSEIRKLVFGNELFDLQLTDEPFTKFKRDIARNIGIKGVL